MNAIKKIEQIRMERKVSQREICDYIGMTRAGYQNMINLNDMKLSTLIKIAEFYNIPVEWFVSDYSSSDQIDRDIDRIFEAMKEVVKDKIVRK